ncbi:FG-GAP-like repeat-containing protein [Thermodesulfobacteriota bacterium]
MLNLLSKNADNNNISDHCLKYRFIFVFFILCLFYSITVLNAAEPGLPFTEDFIDTNLQDSTKTNANWSTKDQAVYLAWRQQIYGALSDPIIWNIGSEMDSTNSIALGDMDGDGDLDVVAGGHGTTKLYFNNGNEIPFYLSNSIVIGWDYTGSIALGDVDGDGDLDVVMGNYANTLNKLYLNDGTGVFSGGISIGSDTDWTFAIALGDVDGDGDLDAVVGNMYNTNKLYLNDGTGVFSGGTDIGSDVDDTESIALGDVNGDGNLDIVVGNTQTNKLYLNDGTGVFSSGTDIGSDTDKTISIALGDMDGDGDLDVVASNYTYVANKLYLNDGDGDPFDTVESGTDIGGAGISYRYQIALGDVDGDGDLDVAQGIFGLNKLYLNDGTGVFSDGMNIGEHTDGTVGIALGDIDGDGDLDVVTGNNDQTNKLYLNDGTDNPFDEVTGTTIGTETDLTNAIALGDIDVDGDLDVVTGNKLYLNNDNGVFADGTVINSNSSSTYSIALGDMDGDGDLDLVVGNSGQTDKLYLNDGTGIFSEGIDISSDTYGNRAIALGDMDGDGDFDVVVGNSYAQANRLYLNNGNGVFADGMDISSDIDWTQSVAIGDVDSDGKLDVVAGNNNARNRLYRNNGTSNPFNEVTGTDINSETYTQKITLGDVDGDGDLDIVAGANSENRLFLNDGTGVFSDGISIGSDTDWTFAIALGDVDGDGDLDVVTGNDGQTNKLYLNDGTGVFSDGTIIGSDIDHTQGIALGDIDGDGDPDVVAGNYGETNKLYLNSYTELTADLYDTGHGIVTSLEIDSESLNNISNATLNATESLPANTRIDYFLSNNGGERYYQVYSGQEFIFPTYGNDLRWRAELHSLSPALTPEIQQITITTSNTEPEVTAGGMLVYIEDDPATPIDGSITVSDIDNVNLEGAAITISSGYQSNEDLLNFIDANNITGFWDAETGVLELSGTSSVENYQTALRSVTYENTSDNPSENERTVEFVVTDGELFNPPVTGTVTVAKTNDAPVILSHEPDPITIIQEEPVSISINTEPVPDIYLETEDPDNIPDDLSLIIQSGENYYVYGDTVFPDTGFFGNLTVPIIVYDGADYGNVYNLVIGVEDITPPTVSSVITQVGGQTVDVTFSELMSSNAATNTNYVISGDGQGTLSGNPDDVEFYVSNTYRLTWNSGEMKDGEDITVTALGIQDAAGNPVGSPSSGTDTGGGIGTPPVTDIDNGEGTYQSSVEVTLTCSDTGGSGCSATYYSLDGTDPSLVYSAPITINEDTTLRFLSLDAAGNLEPVQTQIYSIEIPTEITCSLSTETITYGASFIISGSISPSPNAANEGIDIQLIPSSGPAVSLSTDADINGDFELIVECSKINGAGTWMVQTSWEGDTSHLGDTSDPQYLTVNQASSSLSLDVLASEAIKVNSGPPIGGKFTPDPNCGGIIPNNTPILIHVNDPDGGDPITLDAYTNVNGQFLLDYDTCNNGEPFEFNKLGEWTLHAEFKETDNFTGVVTDSVAVRVVPTAGYAIIIQGRIASDEGMASHHKTASFVYEKLKGRQILDDDIQYLSWMGDSRVDKSPSRSNIEEAITIWAKDKMDPDYIPPDGYMDEAGQPGDLYIIFIDHGWTNSNNDEEGEFYIHPDAPLTSTELSGWVTDLQDHLELSESSYDRNIVMLLGFCRAGAFIEELSHENRVIIASAAKNEASHRGPRDVDDNNVPLRDGEYFISEFFKSVSYGKSIKESFEDATLLTEAFTSSGSGIINAPYDDDSVQHPLLDDNGDQLGSNILPKGEGKDGYYSEFLYIGASPPEGNDPGDVLVTKVNYAQFLEVGETSVNLWAEVDDPGDLRFVWVEVKAPNYDPEDPGEGFQIEMETFKKATEELDIDNSNRYLWPGVGSGSDPADLFDIPGTYQVFYFAKDDTTGHVSPLVSNRIYKAKDGNNPPGDFDLLEPLDEDTVTTVLPLMWEKSYDLDDPPDPVTYTVEISEDMGFSSFAFKKEGITDELLFIDSEYGLEDYTAYYWRVIAIDQYGAQTYSSVRSFFTDNTNGIPGYIMGIVITELGVGLVGANVEAGDYSTITHSDGTYKVSLPSGDYDVVVTADGFESGIQTVTVTAEDYSNQDFVLDPIDSDNDGTPDYEDECPSDPNKITPGECGCWIADTDSDGDGIADCNDNYPDDYDNDGMPDEWEEQNGLDPLVDDADEDADADGYTNLTEYRRGTDPNDYQSQPSKAMPWLQLLLEE